MAAFCVDLRWGGFKDIRMVNPSHTTIFYGGGATLGYPTLVWGAGAREDSFPPHQPCLGPLGEKNRGWEITKFRGCRSRSGVWNPCPTRKRLPASFAPPYVALSPGERNPWANATLKPFVFFQDIFCCSSRILTVSLLRQLGSSRDPRMRITVKLNGETAKVGPPEWGSGPDYFSFWSHFLGAQFAVFATIQLLSIQVRETRSR